MKNLKVILVVLSLATLVSCSSFSEEHYFKDRVTSSTNGDVNIVPNYYKVKICGYSFLSSSRYVSGYFDQNAINLYFNEIVQPENAKLFNTKTDADNNNSLVTNEAGNELVVVLSSNAKAVTEYIGSIAKNQNILNSIAQITQKEKIEEANAVKSEISFITNETQNFILKTDLYLNELSTRGKDKEKQQVIKDYLSSIKD
ncbi:hypothetical protein [Flavobacterium sp. U410]|jgi:hypothetical protein